MNEPIKLKEYLRKNGDEYSVLTGVDEVDFSILLIGGEDDLFNLKINSHAINGAEIETQVTEKELINLRDGIDRFLRVINSNTMI